MARLWEMNPRVAVLADGDRAIGLNPQLLDDEQPAIVLASLRRVLEHMDHSLA